MAPLDMDLIPTTTSLDDGSANKEVLQKSPLQPNMIAVDLYQPPIYQSTSIIRDMHKTYRFGRPSNITVLFSDSNNNNSKQEYIQGVFAWSIFMIVSCSTWFILLLVMKRIGQYHVGFLSGWPPLDPSVKYNKQIRKQQQRQLQKKQQKQKAQSRASKKGQQYSQAGGQDEQISAMDENEGNHDPNESHHGSSLFLSSEEGSSSSSSSLPSYASKDISSSTVDHLSVDHLSLNSGREMDLNNIFINTMTPTTTQQTPSYIGRPGLHSIRQASQGEMELEALTLMQPSPGESALSLSSKSNSNNNSPPPSVQLSARFTFDGNTTNGPTNLPLPKLPFMVRSSDEDDNAAGTRTPQVKQKLSHNHQPQPQQLQSLKNNPTFMSNPQNVSLFISSMKEESLKKRAAETSNTTNNTQTATIEQEATNTTPPNNDDTSNATTSNPSAVSIRPIQTRTMNASGDNNNNTDDVTDTTHSEESSDLSQQPTILHTNQGVQQSTESAGRLLPSTLTSSASASPSPAGQPNASFRDMKFNQNSSPVSSFSEQSIKHNNNNANSNNNITQDSEVSNTPKTTNSRLVPLTNQRASPESVRNIATAPSTVNNESSFSNYGHESMGEVGLMAPVPLPNNSTIMETPSNTDGSIFTHTNNTMNGNDASGDGQNNGESPATATAAERLELEQMRSEAHAATHKVMMDHLNIFLHKKPNGTYEEWIEDLHPENVQSRRDVVNGKQIDHRFYMRDSHHRNLWNDSIVPGKERAIVPERSYYDGDKVNGGVDTFENEPLLTTLSTKTLPYDNAMLDKDPLERTRIRRNRFLLASRVIVLLSCVIIIIASFLFLFKGVRSLAQSLNSVESGITAVEDVTNDGIKLLDKYFYKAKEARTYADEFFTDGSTFCLDKRNDAKQLCNSDNAFDLDGTSKESECKVASIQKSIEDLRSRFEALKSNIFEEASNFRTDLDEILDTTSEVKESLDGFHWAWGVSATFAVTLDVIVVALMHDVIQTWKGSQGCMPNWCGRKFLLPIFVLNVILMWIFASLFVSGAIITSDFCYNSPDDVINQALANKEEDFSPFTFNLLGYYIGGCADTSNPVKQGLDNLGNEAIKIAYIITAGHTVLSNLGSVDSDLIMSFCGRDSGPFEAAATFFDATFHALLEVVEDVRELMFCDNWNPIYTSIAYDAVCYDGAKGLSWIYASLATIGFFGMVILTFRYVLLPDTIEQDSVCTPRGNSNGDNGNRMSSLRQRRWCCTRKSRIPRTVIMSSRASSNSPSSK